MSTQTMYIDEYTGEIIHEVTFSYIPVYWLSGHAVYHWEGLWQDVDNPLFRKWQFYEVHYIELHGNCAHCFLYPRIR